MSKTEKTPGRKPNAALMKPVQPDDALAVILGATPLPRGELTKKLWGLHQEEQAPRREKEDFDQRR
jgi:chromatin remodeling complex protein RSC6